MPISRFYKPFSQDSSIYEDLKDKEEWAVIENSQWVDIHDSYQLQVSDFMDHWLRIFEKEDRVLHHSFQHEALETDNNELKYDDFIFDAIIFAEGIGIVNNPFFNKLPIKPNRGEALKIKVRDFRLSKIIQKGKFICPFEGDYWIGSSYENVEHLQISKTSKILEELKDAIPVLIGPKDVEMIEHLGAFRVTIGDRRPIIGAHQKFGNLFLFNGFGTKGASLIPYFARELTNHILLSQEMNMEVRLSRFIKTI
jgi:glycine/D-amino acid oxidase-like deaminating enzyme